MASRAVLLSANWSIERLAPESGSGREVRDSPVSRAAVPAKCWPLSRGPTAALAAIFAAAAYAVHTLDRWQSGSMAPIAQHLKTASALLRIQITVLHVEFTCRGGDLQRTTSAFPASWLRGFDARVGSAPLRQQKDPPLSLTLNGPAQGAAKTNMAGLEGYVKIYRARKE